MRKNKFMRAASGLLVAVLLTTCVISGTFAKYTTESKGEDSARVAKWGFTEGSTLELTDLFKNAYTDTTNGETVKSTSGDVIAPGTEGEATFAFKYEGDSSVDKPEVKYDFTVSTDGSDCNSTIIDNKSIVWSLDGKECSSWGELLDKIKALSGDPTGTKTYNAGELPTEFSTGTNTHTVSWKWKFDNSNDTEDTTMGNAITLANVKLKITITATQID